MSDYRKITDLMLSWCPKCKKDIKGYYDRKTMDRRCSVCDTETLNAEPKGLASGVKFWMNK